MIHRHSSPGEGLATLRMQPVPVNGTTPRHVIPSGVEESSHVAIFILWLFLILRGGFLYSACAAVEMTDVSGLAVTNVNVPRFRPCGPGGGRLPPLQWGVP